MTNELHNVYRNKEIAARQTDELIGFARGIIADGVVNQVEVENLRKWLVASVGVTGNAMLAGLLRTVDDVMADGVLDPDEADLMLSELRALCGDGFELGEELKSTTLPLCDPAPVIAHDGSRFCFTGRFNFGSRRECEAKATELGGSGGTLTKKTDFLVIGIYVTESWKHTTYGNKIIKATEMRDGGVPIRIVSEDHWVTHH